MTDDDALTELELAYMDVQASEILRSNAAKRMNAAVRACAKRGISNQTMARRIDVDKSTIARRRQPRSNR